MFSTLVLCSIIALAFCCISLLYFYYSKLKHIAYLESQLMSLKMMFANYQNSVEHKLLKMADGGKMVHPNVITLLDNSGSSSSNSLAELSTNPELLNSNPILSDLVNDDDLVANGPIPFFKIVSMTSNPIFQHANEFDSLDKPQITEIIENQNVDELKDLELEDVSNEQQITESQLSNDLELEIDLDEITAVQHDEDIKTISLDNKKNVQSIITTSSDSAIDTDAENVKTVNLQPDVDFKLTGNLENSLEGIMDELEELSEIASVCDEVRTVNLNTMTATDLANLSVKELKELCAKYNIKNKKGTKNELIERINQINRS